MIRFKRLIVAFILVCFIPFVTAPKKAKANAFVAPLLPTIAEGLASVGGAISGIIGSPYALIICVIAIGLGVVFNNVDDITAFIQNVVDKAKEMGEDLGALITNVDGQYIAKPKLIEIINQTVQEYQISHDSTINGGVVAEIDISNFNYDTALDTTGFIQNKNIFRINLEDNFNYTFKLTLNRGLGYCFGSDLLFAGQKLITAPSIMPTSATGKNSTTYYYNLNTSVIPYEYNVSLSLDNLYKDSNQLSTNITDKDFVLNMNVFNPLYTSIGNQLYKDSVFSDTTLTIESIINNTSIGALDNYTGDFTGDLVADKDIAITIPTDLTLDNLLTKDLEGIKANDITLDNTISSDIPIDTPIDTPLPSENETKKELDLTPLKINFSKVFPFCIPFDFVNLIKSFSAEKVRPVYHVELPQQYFNSYSFDLDLAFYDDYFPITPIFRYSLLVYFVVFLMKNTRRFMGV